jgi:hypothetical protein
MLEFGRSSRVYQSQMVIFGSVIAKPKAAISHQNLGRAREDGSGLFVHSDSRSPAAATVTQYRSPNSGSTGFSNREASRVTIVNPEGVTK